MTPEALQKSLGELQDQAREYTDAAPVAIILVYPEGDYASATENTPEARQSLRIGAARLFSEVHQLVTRQEADE